MAFGTFASNAVMFFVILCTGLTLNAHGVTVITSSRQVAEALRPLAGSAASLLLALGLIGAGFLAVPILTGSAGYAVSQAFGGAARSGG